MTGPRQIQRPALLPLNPLYRLVVGIRNLFFDHGILPSVSFRIPVIVIGNITAGGTGKTPHVEYLVGLLKNDFRIAVLSRGYKRKTRDFRMAAPKSSVTELGDEPMQIKSKFPDVSVAVDRNRVNGVNRLISEFRKLEVIILDDAFQHRYIKPGLSILLVDHGRPVFNDVLLPAGNLREPWRNATRANIVIVTKCPDHMSPNERAVFTGNLRLSPKQAVYFTRFEYGLPIEVFPGKRKHPATLTFKQLRKSGAGILLVTGIANPRPLREFLDKNLTIAEEVIFPDHHTFTYKNIHDIKARLRNFTTENNYILVTEKDAIRLRELEIADRSLLQAFYYIPVAVKFLAKGEKPFVKKIYKYLKKAVI
jgi:tetraacyldisaccharide 4'-kinase